MNKTCDKCGQSMELIIANQDSFLMAREIYMCKKCKRLQPA